MGERGLVDRDCGVVVVLIGETEGVYVCVHVLVAVPPEGRVDTVTADREVHLDTRDVRGVGG